MATSSSTNGPGLKVIHAGLFRMGTKSMAQAYKILGLKTHHGLLEDVTETPWVLIEQAAEAMWPSVPGAVPRPPFQRGGWDKLWGKYDVATDLASPFVLELIKSYPEAKVVIAQREFESWWPSFKSELLDNVLSEPTATYIGFLIATFLNNRSVYAMKKVLFGFFHAKTRQEISKERGREVYDAYFREIRELVPPERRLEYKLGSGWEPLCTFLDAKVPDVEFPKGNDTAAHGEETKSRRKKLLLNSVTAISPWLVALLVGWAAWSHMKSKKERI